MALENCKHCGASISSLALSCPKCGGPNEVLEMKKGIEKHESRLGILGLALAILLLYLLYLNWTMNTEGGVISSGDGIAHTIVSMLLFFFFNLVRPFIDYNDCLSFMASSNYVSILTWVFFLGLGWSSLHEFLIKIAKKKLDS